VVSKVKIEMQCSLPGKRNLFSLTEQFGDFNVAKMSLDNPQNATAVTIIKNMPVRFLSISDDGTLCYSFNGELYARKPGDANSQKINVNHTRRQGKKSRDATSDEWRY